jgi:glutamine synthetase
MKGDVFTEELISTWIQTKRREEAQSVDVRPHPYEFCLYYDV